MPKTIILDLIIGLGFFLALFVYWKRLREDYTANQIFTSGTYLLLGTLFGGLVAGNLISARLPHTAYFYPDGLWFKGALVGLLIALFFSMKKMGFKFHETFEASLLFGLTWFFVTAIGYSVLYGVQNIILAGNTLIALVSFKFFDSRYRRYTWYKSGKVGFAGISSAALFFLIRSIIAILNPSMVSFVGKIDSLISATIAFALFLVVYNLSSHNG